MNDTITKIITHTEGLNNELANLSIMLNNIAVKDKEQKDFDAKRQLYNKDAAEREARILNDLHRNEETKKQNERDKVEIEVKQNKLQSEWSRMLEAKEKLEKDIEEAAREKLRLANKAQELAEKERALTEKTQETDSIAELQKKKQVALDELNKQLEIKKKITERKAKEIDSMYDEAS